MFRLSIAPSQPVTDPLDAFAIIETLIRRMPATIQYRPPFGLLRRMLAAGCAGLVLALTIFAASPTAHGLLHDDDHQHAVGEDTCAVVMFAGGASLPVAPLSITPPTNLVQTVSPVTCGEVFLVSPRYLRHPERGPPLGWVS